MKHLLCMNDMDELLCKCASISTSIDRKEEWYDTL